MTHPVIKLCFTQNFVIFLLTACIQVYYKLTNNLFSTEHGKDAYKFPGEHGGLWQLMSEHELNIIDKQVVFFLD